MSDAMIKSLETYESTLSPPMFTFKWKMLHDSNRWHRLGSWLGPVGLAREWCGPIPSQVWKFGSAQSLLRPNTPCRACSLVLCGGSATGQHEIALCKGRKEGLQVYFRKKKIHNIEKKIQNKKALTEGPGFGCSTRLLEVSQARWPWHAGGESMESPKLQFFVFAICLWFLEVLFF